jgi:hypothetical protein
MMLKTFYDNYISPPIKFSVMGLETLSEMSNGSGDLDLREMSSLKMST